MGYPYYVKMLQACAAGALVVISFPCFPQTALSLDEALRLAVQESRQLTAQRAAITAAEQAKVSARELPDPKLRMGVDNLPVDGPDRLNLTRDFMTMRKIGVAQDFPRAEKRELKGRKADRQVEREGAMLADTRAIVRREVAAAWIERYFAEEMGKVVDGQRAETELQRKALEAALRANKTQPAELLAVQVSLQSLLDRRADFDRQAARATAMLSRWLGDDSARPLAPLVLQRVSPHSAEVTGHVEHHPHIEALDAEISLAEADAALARAAQKPDWGMELMYAQRGPQYSNMVSVQVAIDLPVFQGRRQDRDLAARLAQVDQARALKEDALRQHLAEARAAWGDWQAAAARIARYDETLLPLARERTKLALAGYSGGQGALAPVLEARRMEVELALQKLQLAADQSRAYAQLLYFLPEDEVK
jgi:outer membrane protein TolC